jgi:hypothetical protein
MQAESFSESSGNGGGAAGFPYLLTLPASNTHSKYTTPKPTCSTYEQAGSLSAQIKSRRKASTPTYGCMMYVWHLHAKVILHIGLGSDSSCRSLKLPAALCAAFSSCWLGKVAYIRPLRRVGFCVRLSVNG